MRYSVKLDEWLHDCPPGWKNFIKMMREEYPDDRGDLGFSELFINEVLSTYDATVTMIDNNFGDTHLVFETDEGLLAFRLKFGI